MRFTSLEIENFRQYQSLSFRFPKTKPCDLHIIVADNGVGKTNILNAITWCLYGDEPHLGDESRSLPRVNLKAKNEAVQRGDTTVFVSVRVCAEDGDGIVEFSRRMKVQLDTDFEWKSELTVTVKMTGDAQIFEGEEAASYVEKYMPKKIRQYFYFDGEQLNSYFISEESSQHPFAHRDAAGHPKGDSNHLGHHLRAGKADRHLGGCDQDQHRAAERPGKPPGA